MFSSRRTIRPDAEPVDLAAEAIRAIRRGAELQLAQRTLDGLRSRFAEVQERIRGLAAASRGPAENSAGRKRELALLERELAELGSQTGPAFRALTLARQGYDERVDMALRPLRQAAARDGLQAIVDLRGAIGQFDMAGHTARQVGAPELRRPQALDQLDAIEALFARIVK